MASRCPAQSTGKLRPLFRALCNSIGDPRTLAVCLLREQVNDTYLHHQQSVQAASSQICCVKQGLGRIACPGGVLCAFCHSVIRHCGQMERV